MKIKFIGLLSCALTLVPALGFCANSFVERTVQSPALFTHDDSSATDPTGGSGDGTTITGHRKHKSRRSKASTSSDTQTHISADSTASQDTTTPKSSSRRHRRKSSSSTTDTSSDTTNSGQDNGAGLDSSQTTPPSIATGKHHRRTRGNKSTMGGVTDNSPQDGNSGVNSANPAPTPKKLGFFARLRAAHDAKAAAASNGSTSDTASSTRHGLFSSSSGQFVGNKNSKIYHMPGDKNLPDPKNRVYFSSAAAAEAAGYRVSKTGGHSNQ
jgi:hypothetical protein